MSRLAVLGAGGHGKVVGDAALLAGWESIAFFDDAWPGVSTVGPWEVVGSIDALVVESRQFAGAVVAIGDNAARLARLGELERHAITVVSVVHPAAAVSPFAHMSAGSVVFAGAVINPFARIGQGCIISTCASVDHDCELGDGVHVSPGARLGGGVRVGRASWIGIGASVKHGVTIGSDVTVGAGAAVTDDVADGMTVVGVPARPI